MTGTMTGSSSPSAFEVTVKLYMYSVTFRRKEKMLLAGEESVLSMKCVSFMLLFIGTLNVIEEHHQVHEYTQNSEDETWSKKENWNDRSGTT